MAEPKKYERKRAYKDQKEKERQEDMKSNGRAERAGTNSRRGRRRTSLNKTANVPGPSKETPTQKRLDFMRVSLIKEKAVQYMIAQECDAEQLIIPSVSMITEPL